MKNVSLLLILSVVTISGCFSGKLAPRNPRQTNEATAGGLSVRLSLPNWEFTQGETFTATVTVKNLTARPMTIHASTGAPVYIRLLRHTPLGWEEVIRYPKSEIMFMNNWTLGPREERKFPMRLTVGQDWPIGDVVRMVAEVNGRSEPTTGIVIGVYAPGQKSAKK